MKTARRLLVLTRSNGNVSSSTNLLPPWISMLSRFLIFYIQFKDGFVFHLTHQWPRIIDKGFEWIFRVHMPLPLTCNKWLQFGFFITYIKFIWFHHALFMQESDVTLFPLLLQWYNGYAWAVSENWILTVEGIFDYLYQNQFLCVAFSFFFFFF